MEIGISIKGESAKMIMTMPETWAPPAVGDYWNLTGDPTKPVMVSGYFRVVKRQCEMHGAADEAKLGDCAKITAYGWSFVVERA